VVGPAPARPARSTGRSRGAGAPREPARSAAVDPGPDSAWTRASCLPGVGGSSVSLTCSYADQGGCHVDMVVGADHRGRCCVAVWRDAGPSSPLTALRHQPDHGWRSCSTRPTAWRRGRCVQAQRAQPTPSVARPGGIGYQPGLGPVPLGHREQFVAGKAAWFGFAQQRRGRCWPGGGGHRQPQPVAHRSDQPRLGLSSCEGSCSRPRPGPRPGTTPPMPRRVSGVRPTAGSSRLLWLGRGCKIDREPS
jgi:hypothetical protein